jgi:hypothetical protein
MYSLKSLIGPSNTRAQSEDGTWYRLVPVLQPTSLVDRCLDAFQVLSGAAYAVSPPTLGELEGALEQKAAEGVRLRSEAPAAREAVVQRRRRKTDAPAHEGAAEQG